MPPLVQTVMAAEKEDPVAPQPAVDASPVSPRDSLGDYAGIPNGFHPDPLNPIRSRKRSTGVPTGLCPIIDR